MVFSTHTTWCSPRIRYDGGTPLGHPQGITSSAHGMDVVASYLVDCGVDFDKVFDAAQLLMAAGLDSPELLRACHAAYLQQKSGLSQQGVLKVLHHRSAGEVLAELGSHGGAGEMVHVQMQVPVDATVGSYLQASVNRNGKDYHFSVVVPPGAVPGETVLTVPVPIPAEPAAVSAAHPAADDDAKDDADEFGDIELAGALARGDPGSNATLNSLLGSLASSCD